jgi:serine/threonine protein kinase
MPGDKQHTPSNTSRQKYQLLMELGRGGMGEVHLALLRGPQGFVKLAVLKMLKRQLVGRADSYRMFLDEARILARLAHPNIVQLHEVIEYDGTPTIVMEYLEGQPLSSIPFDGPTALPMNLHLYVLTKVLSGLHACHELRNFDGTALNLIHRDISPHNVYVLFDGQVKVLDFGIAKTTDSSVETQTGELKGKIRYMAPEQLAGSQLDRRADIFSVGVMMWEALARRRLWGDTADGEVMLKLLTKKLPALPDYPDITPELVEICNRGLAYDCADRYGTAAAFQHDLERYLETQAHCSAEEVATYMRDHFDEARVETNRLIDAHIKRASLSPAANEDATVIGPKPNWTTWVRRRSAAKRWPSVLGAGLAAVAVGAAVIAVRAFQHGGTQSAGAPASATVVECGPGHKRCAEECVSLDRPDHGCGSDNCQSCAVANATARCNVRGQCDIAVCYQDFDNCDGDASNGCEANVRIDPDHCGGCGRKCPPLPHAQRGCGDVCTIWRCESGFRDCNHEVSDGCEIRASDDPKNCGHCGHACGAHQSCRQGKCVP